MGITPEDTGSFIHQCGTIEFFINQILIEKPDNKPQKKIYTESISRRASLLRKTILKTSPKTSKKELNNLVKDINKLFKQRNRVAHNPMVSETKSHSNMKVVYFEGDQLKDFLKKDIVQASELATSILERLQPILKEVSPKTFPD